eukprot:6039696-Amphidinium_carterae.1
MSMPSNRTCKAMLHVCKGYMQESSFQRLKEDIVSFIRGWRCPLLTRAHIVRPVCRCQSLPRSKDLRIVIQGGLIGACPR